jgi:tetraacyldisaccharide 4'-kinase
VILSAASAVYGAAAAWRRRWYAGDPSRRRRLTRPVISVGNLRTGGSGKTPVVEHIARELAARGECPAVLTRGYARVAPSDGVTVVSDGASVLAAVDRAGDEPLMLARALPGVPVLVGADRYLSGRMAEERFGATVHLLDDGFQHLTLARDVDLLIAGHDDLADHVLPAGHLRERITAARAADALLIRDEGSGEDEALQRALGIATSFHVRRVLGMPRWIDSGEAADLGAGEPVLALAGIARPERFFADLTAMQLRVVGTQTFRDHHQYTGADMERIMRAARAISATVILTTEKDAVRLPAGYRADPRIAAVPLSVTIEPPAFIDWLLARLGATRPGPEPRAPSPE